MKTTITTIAAGLLAAFLILSPAFASAATTYTLTVHTGFTTYAAGFPVTVTGSVSPAPGAGTEVGLQVSNPLNTLVATGAASVTGATGAYSWTFTAGSSSSWPSGTYTVTATWALTASSQVYTASTTFGFTGTTTTAGGGTTVSTIPTILVHVGTPALVWPGDVVQIAFQTLFANNGSLAPAKSVTANLINPAGVATAITSWSNPSTGMYWTTWTVPSSAATGTYFVTVWVNDSKVVGAGLGSMEYNSGIATSAAQAAASSQLSSISSALSGLSSSLSGLSSSLSSMGSSMGQSIATLQSTAGNIQTAVGTISSSITSLQNGITSLQNSLNTVQGNTQDLGGLSNQMSSVNSSISNNQTYLLVVAALVVITLVLELAILVRKLS